MPSSNFRSGVLQHARLVLTMAFIASIGVLGYLLLKSAPAQAQSSEIFKDVSSDYYYADAIKALKDSGIIQGNPDGTYEPTSKINRAAFTAIVVRAINPGPFTGKNCFPDVHEEWYAGTSCFAKDSGLVSGFADGSFKPGNDISFSEAAKILSNSYKLMKGTASEDKWVEVFTKSLADNKAIPLSIEYFDEPVTRDEMAEMVYRLEDHVTDKASRTYDEIKGEGLITVDSCKALEERYQETLNYNNDGGIVMPLLPPSLLPRTGGGSDETSSPDAGQTAPATDTKNAMSTGSGNYSTTNTQVEGVDEGDIVKNDGKYIYILKGNTVRIVEAYPSENLKELVSVTLGDKGENIYPIEMYIENNVLTVIGSKSFSYPIPMPVDDTKAFTQEDVMPEAKMMPPYYYQNRTKVFVLDVSDHMKPMVKRSVEFDGDYRSSRRIGDTLYAVINKYAFYGYPASDAKTSPGQNIFVPMMKDSMVGKDEQTAPCNQIKMLPKPDQFNFLTVAAIPLKDSQKAVNREVILGDTQQIYASENNLYVAAPHWRSGSYGDTTEQTAFYKFALDNGMVEYKAYGRVPGTILNQFSMDEKDNYFRVATTNRNYDSGKTTNNLYVMGEALNPVGKIEGIAPDESIYSVRFMGNRAYMVTFKQVDPFFAIDLTDPKAPKILGKLKIPGYSNYLEPYDDNHLIGFGNEVDNVKEGQPITFNAIHGMKLSLFDVSNINNPQELFKEVIGDTGTYSDVLNNHKALLFDKEKGLMAFPVTVYEPENNGEKCSDYTYSSCPSSCQQICKPSVCNFENGLQICTADCDGQNSCVAQSISPTKLVFSGAYVYNVDLQKGFSLKGKVTHFTPSEEADMQNNGYITAYDKTISRILYIADRLYTVSMGMVKANDIVTMQEKNSTPLAGDMNQWYGPMVK